MDPQVSGSGHSNPGRGNHSTTASHSATHGRLPVMSRARPWSSPTKSRGDGGAKAKVHSYNSFKQIIEGKTFHPDDFAGSRSSQKVESREATNGTENKTAAISSSEQEIKVEYQLPEDIGTRLSYIGNDYELKHAHRVRLKRETDPGCSNLQPDASQNQSSASHPHASCSQPNASKIGHSASDKQTNRIRLKREPDAPSYITTFPRTNQHLPQVLGNHYQHREDLSTDLDYLEQRLRQSQEYLPGDFTPQNQPRAVSDHSNYKKGYKEKNGDGPLRDIRNVKHREEDQQGEDVRKFKFDYSHSRPLYGDEETQDYLPHGLEFSEVQDTPVGRESSHFHRRGDNINHRESDITDLDYLHQKSRYSDQHPLHQGLGYNEEDDAYAASDMPDVHQRHRDRKSENKDNLGYAYQKWKYNNDGHVMTAFPHVHLGVGQHRSTDIIDVDSPPERQHYNQGQSDQHALEDPPPIQRRKVGSGDEDFIRSVQSSQGQKHTEEHLETESLIETPNVHQGKSTHKKYGSRHLGDKLKYSNEHAAHTDHHYGVVDGSGDHLSGLNYLHQRPKYRRQHAVQSVSEPSDENMTNSSGETRVRNKRSEPSTQPMKRTPPDGVESLQTIPSVTEQYLSLVQRRHVPERPPWSHGKQVINEKRAKIRRQVGVHVKDDVTMLKDSKPRPRSAYILRPNNSELKNRRGHVNSAYIPEKSDFDMGESKVSEPKGVVKSKSKESNRSRRISFSQDVEHIGDCGSSKPASVPTYKNPLKKTVNEARKERDDLVQMRREYKRRRMHTLTIPQVSITDYDQKENRNPKIFLRQSHNECESAESDLEDPLEIEKCKELMKSPTTYRNHAKSSQQLRTKSNDSIFLQVDNNNTEPEIGLKKYVKTEDMDKTMGAAIMVHKSPSGGSDDKQTDKSPVVINVGEFTWERIKRQISKKNTYEVQKEAKESFKTAKEPAAVVIGKPRTHFTLALFTLCFCLSPLGLLGMIFAVCSASAYKDRDVELGKKLSKIACILSFIGILGTMATTAILIGTNTIPVLGRYQDYKGPN